VQGSETDRWQKDMVVGLMGVTAPINNLLNTLVAGPINLMISLFNMAPGVNISPLEFNIGLPDLPLSTQVRPGGLFDDFGIHWRGNYDARAGVASTFTGANAYGRLIIPLFEMLGIDPQLIHYSEVEFNQAIANLSCAAEISSMLARSIFNPLLDWLAPMSDAHIPLSLGYRPLSNLLNLLPNLAFAREHNLAERFVADVLDDLQLDVSLHLGGASGAALDSLVLDLANYLQYQLFDLNFFLYLFYNVLPDLIDAPAIAQPLLESNVMAIIFAEPMMQIVQLADPATPYNFTNTFLNRRGLNEQICTHVTVLEGRGAASPANFVRPPTLGSLAGFFGASQRDLDVLHISFDLNLGQAVNTQLPLIDHFSTAFSGLFEQPSVDFTPCEPMQNIMRDITQNPGHAIAWLIEIFNHPQRYPARDFMRYAWVEQAQSRRPVHNPVVYSNIWTRQMADQLAHDLPGFLDNFAEFFFEQNFLTWLDLPTLNRDHLRWGFSPSAQNLTFIEEIIQLLHLHMPLIRILLVEDDLLLMGDMIGFSGYDGYRHGVIPILEAFGVPQRYILTHEEFMAQVGDCDETLIRLMFEPILDVLERVLVDPIFEIPRVVPNIIYFLAAEENGRGNNLVQAINRMLRPLYAIADMISPMAEIDDVMALLGVQYPFVLALGGVTQEIRLPADPSLNAIFTSLLRNWFGDFADTIGLSLELEDLMDLITGTLVLYRSRSGQNDAVRLETDLSDAFTHLARQLIPMMLSEENWAQMRQFLAARLPANTRNCVLHMLDGLANLLRDTDDNRGPDLVLAVLFYLFTGTDCALNHLLRLREFRRQLTAFFQHISENVRLWHLAVLALGAMAVVTSPLWIWGLIGGIIGLMAGIFAGIIGLFAAMFAVPSLLALLAIAPPAAAWLIWRRNE